MTHVLAGRAGGAPRALRRIFARVVAASALIASGLAPPSAVRWPEYHGGPATPLPQDVVK